MKRGDWLFAALGTVLLVAGTHLIRTHRVPARELVLDEACRTPVLVQEPLHSAPIGAVVVFHGLSANRRLMQTPGQWFAAAGLRVFLVDLPGHGDSTEPFSLGRAEQCGAAILESLARRGEINPQRTVLAGHSMGGAIAIRLADRFPALATIAISPAPTNLPRRMPSNLLLVSAQFDMPLLRAAARNYFRAAGGERIATEDFLERRAARLDNLANATHVSVLYDPRVKRASADWARRALLEKPLSPLPPVATAALGSIIGLAGLLFLLPLGASALARVLGATPTSSPSLRLESAARLLLRWTLAGLLAVGMLNFWVPLRALHLMTGDYLASFLLIGAVVLVLLMGKEVRGCMRPDGRPMAVASALGLAVVLGCGAWLNWELTDAWMNTPRWLRFVPLVLLCLPYCCVEELALGPPGESPASQPGRPRRFLLFLALRGALWLALLFGLFALHSGQILLCLLMVYMLAFSIIARWGADLMWRRTGSAAGAAAFSAILAAWFLAAVYPLT